MWRLLCVLPLLAVACQGPGTGNIEEGDRLFYLRDYPQALKVFQDVLREDEEADVRLLSRRIQESRYRILAEESRFQLHIEHPQEALEYLELADDVLPGHSLTKSLRRRCWTMIADSLVAEGEAVLDTGNASLAIAFFERALRLDATHSLAQSSLVLAEDRQASRRRRGESFYFRGLEELEENEDVRALVSFSHAAKYWGEDSKAGMRAQALATSLAEEARARGALLLEAGFSSRARIAYLEANRLQPHDPDSLEALAFLQRFYETEGLLASVEHALLRQDTETARLRLDAALELSPEATTPHLHRLESDLTETRLRREFLQARAAEMDGRSVEAAARFQKLLSEGYAEEVHWRLQRCQDRIQEASMLLEKAKRARASGQEAEAREFQAAARALVVDLPESVD